MTPVSSQVQVRLDRRLPDAVVALVSINNARKLNTLNSQLMHELVTSFKDLTSNPDLRAVVLTGAGDKAFIGGANIDEMIAFDVASARVLHANP